MADERSPMMTGLFRNRDSAERAYGSVTSRGYGRDDVSLLWAYRDTIRLKARFRFFEIGREAFAARWATKFTGFLTSTLRKQ